MPSKHSQIAPSSYWRDAEAQVLRLEADAWASRTAEYQLFTDEMYDRIEIHIQSGRRMYSAHYRQGVWTTKGRVTKRLSQHEAIALIAERLEVDAVRALVALDKPAPVRGEPGAEALRVAEWAGGNEAPIKGPRGLPKWL